MRHWRKMTWTLLAFNVLMLVWTISAGSSSANCSAEQQFEGACKAGETVGRGVAVGLIMGLWFMGFIVISLVWFMTRPRER